MAMIWNVLLLHYIYFNTILSFFSLSLSYCWPLRMKMAMQATLSPQAKAGAPLWPLLLAVLLFLSQEKAS